MENYIDDFEPVLDTDLFGDSKDILSIKILQEFEPPEGYWLAFSGGKDSTVLYDIAVRAGVRFDAHYARTGIDPPELTAHIKKYYPDVIWDSPKTTFFKGFITNGPPTRIKRWCCRQLKEYSGKGRIVATGVRAEESNKRSTYTIVRDCQRLKKIFISPILNWTSNDVWTYIKRKKIPYCCLYDEGFERIGCVFCPFESNTKRSMNRWPKMWSALRRMVDKEFPTKSAWQKFGSSQYLWDWWINNLKFSNDINIPQLFDPNDIIDDEYGDN